MRLRIRYNVHKCAETGGYHGEDQSIEKLRAEADKIGFPVMIKETIFMETQAHVFSMRVLPFTYVQG